MDTANVEHKQLTCNCIYFNVEATTTLLITYTHIYIQQQSLYFGDCLFIVFFLYHNVWIIFVLYFFVWKE